MVRSPALVFVIVRFSRHVTSMSSNHEIMSSASSLRGGRSRNRFGFERVVGKLGGRSGSFVLQGSGIWKDGVATTTWSVVPGSGTGELKGLRGNGSFAAGREAEVSYGLDYEME